MSSSKLHKGGIFGSKPKLVFKASQRRTRLNLKSQGIYVWSGGAEATAQDIRMSSDGRRFTSSHEFMELARPTPTPALPGLEDTTMDTLSPVDDFEEVIIPAVRESKPRKRYFVSVSFRAFIREL